MCQARAHGSACSRQKAHSQHSKQVRASRASLVRATASAFSSDPDVANARRGSSQYEARRSGLAHHSSYETQTYLGFALGFFGLCPIPPLLDSNQFAISWREALFDSLSVSAPPFVTRIGPDSFENRNKCAPIRYKLQRIAAQHRPICLEESFQSLRDKGSLVDCPGPCAQTEMPAPAPSRAEKTENHDGWTRPARCRDRQALIETRTPGRAPVPSDAP